MVVGLIGWLGFAVIAALLAGYAQGPAPLALAASIAAAAQVIALRAGFRLLGMDRLGRGAAWGAATGLAIVAAEIFAFDLLRRHAILSLATGAYVGPAVGLFLSYFHNDDRRIEAEAAADGRPVDYGRDAHWLEPFAFGAVAYLVAFLPRAAGFGFYVLVVGAMTGVVAAGISHFFLSRWGNAAWTVLLAAAAGAVPGAASGFLFRHFQAALSWPWAVHGAMAGMLAFGATAARGVRVAELDRA